MSTALRVAPIIQEWADVELIAAVRTGNDVAFEQLYSRYSRQIGSYVQGMVGDHGRAEDITQEIFIAALRRIRATDRAITFKPWIYEIAKNACIDSFRRTKRAQEISLDADDGLSSADRGRLVSITTMDAAFDSRQALQDLRGAFGGLSESHHEILVLRELEGRSYDDIGERLGMSRPVVESTLFRARRRLAEEYDELTSGRRCQFVHKLVDSGPQYSLGIRDRRRMSRHLAHCHSCRTLARRAGFDDSILSLPAAARIAALLPIPFLRRWNFFGGHVDGGVRARSSAVALRSVHALARSSDQFVGASSGAGRAAATTAAIVLAGVGGGIATVTSSGPVRSPSRMVHAKAAAPYGARGSSLAPAGKTMYPRSTTAFERKASVASARASSNSSSAKSGAGSGSSGAGTTTAAGPAQSAPAGTGAGHESTSSGAEAPAAGMGTSTGDPTTGGSGAADPTAAGSGSGGDPTTAGSGTADPTTGGSDTSAPTTTGSGASPTGTTTLPVVGALPTGALPTGTLPSGLSGTVSTTLGGVLSGAPSLPVTVGATTAANS